MVIQGIIRPPPDIRVVAERTAMFVAKNGRAFESRILNSAKGKTPKFAFLQPTSPFHAYYEDRIMHFESGGGKEDEKKNEEDMKEADGTKTPAAEAASKPTAKDKVTKQKASIMDPAAKAIMGQRFVITNHLKKEKGKRRKEASESEKATADGESDVPPQSEKMLPLPAPPIQLDTVHVVAPYYLTPTQIETIQLVAQIVAMDGKGGPFLPALVSREWSNPDFGFCQPRNIHFSYFSALVDAYRKIIADLVEVANESSKAPVEGSSKPPTTTTPASKIEEDEKLQTPSNKSTRPLYDVQAALNDAAYRTEYERELERRRQKHQENSNAAMEDGEIANAIDWQDFVVVETIDFPIEEQIDVGLSMLPTKKATTTANDTKGVVEITDMDMEESEESEDEADNIRVVPSYTPKVVGTYDPSTARAVDPITGKSIAVADMPEHMRIQLLDPKWAEERKKFQDKQKDSNLVGGDTMVANIAWMSQKAAAVAPTMSTTTSTLSTSAKRLTSSVPIAPVVGPADSRRTGQQHGGFRPPSTEMELPATKRQRTNSELPPPLLQQQQKHKVTIAPPLVTHTQIFNHSNDSIAASKPPNPATADLMRPTQDAPPIASPQAAEEKKLLSAEEFILTLGENPVVELQVRVPNDATSQNWNFFGQTVTVEGISPRSSVKEVKTVLSKQHLNSMPINKIQLKWVSTDDDTKGKFLNNNNATLAALNIGPTALLELKSRKRGGRN